MPAIDQIPLLRAAGGLTRGIIVGVDMRCAVLDGGIHAHTSLQSLVQIATLGDVHGNPLSVRVPLGIDEIAGQRAKGSGDGIGLVLVVPPRLTRPVHCGGRGPVAMRLTTEPLLQQVHLVPTGTRPRRTVKRRRSGFASSNLGKSGSLRWDRSKRGWRGSAGEKVKCEGGELPTLNVDIREVAARSDSPRGWRRKKHWNGRSGYPHQPDGQNMDLCSPGLGNMFILSRQNELPSSTHSPEGTL